MFKSSKSRRQLMNTKLLALASLIAIAGAAPAAADLWVPGEGQSCAAACLAHERVSLNKGAYGFVCRANPENAGQREGVNASLYKYRSVCRVAFGRTGTFDAPKYECRCHP
jgi:hypothetical protein